MKKTAGTFHCDHVLLFIFADMTTRRYCPTCKCHQQATKKVDVWSLPDLVIIHLKRFSQNAYGRDKLDILVDFPVEEDLDLSDYVKGPAKPEDGLFRLYAVDNHFGGLGGGHCRPLFRSC